MKSRMIRFYDESLGKYNLFLAPKYRLLKFGISEASIIQWNPEIPHFLKSGFLGNIMIFNLLFLRHQKKITRAHHAHVYVRMTKFQIFQLHLPAGDYACIMRTISREMSTPISRSLSPSKSFLHDPRMGNVRNLLDADKINFMMTGTF